MEKIKALVVEPCKKAYVKEIKNKLEEMQKLVGGEIAAFYPFENDLFCYCNSNSKIEGLDPNWAWLLHDKTVDIVCGTFVVLADAGEGKDKGLSEDEIAFATEFFNKNRLVPKSGFKDVFVIVSNLSEYLKYLKED